MMHPIKVAAVRIWDISTISQRKVWAPASLNVVCPYCQTLGNITLQFTSIDPNVQTLQAVGSCPGCNQMSRFWIHEPSHYEEGKQRPQEPCKAIFMYPKPSERIFDEVIRRVSERFCEIYNQSLIAEQGGLSEICGMGYRKALEFLIKDYLIKNDPEEKEHIEGRSLGSCISTHIKTPNILEVAKRAVWLGNDETHYVRKWQGKTLDDLKKLIDATIYWIEQEELIKELIKAMPSSSDCS